MATKRCNKIAPRPSKEDSKNVDKAVIEQLKNAIKKKVEEKDGAKKAAQIIEELLKQK